MYVEKLCRKLGKLKKHFCLENTVHLEIKKHSHSFFPVFLTHNYIMPTMKWLILRINLHHFEFFFPSRAPISTNTGTGKQAHLEAGGAVLASFSY